MGYEDFVVFIKSEVIIKINKSDRSLGREVLDFSIFYYILVIKILS